MALRNDFALRRSLTENAIPSSIVGAKNSAIEGGAVILRKLCVKIPSYDLRFAPRDQHEALATLLMSFLGGKADMGWCTAYVRQ
jgi:hypothetical protein